MKGWFGAFESGFLIEVGEFTFEYDGLLEDVLAVIIVLSVCGALFLYVIRKTRKKE